MDPPCARDPTGDLGRRDVPRFSRPGVWGLGPTTGSGPGGTSCGRSYRGPPIPPGIAAAPKSHLHLVHVMRNRTHVRNAILTLLLPAALASSGPPAIAAEPGTGAKLGTPSETLTTPEGLRESAFEDAFLKRMIHRHHSAIAMARLADDRAASEKLKGLASKMADAQESEVGKMTTWLDEWHDASPEPQFIDERAEAESKQNLEQLRATRRRGSDRHSRGHLARHKDAGGDSGPPLLRSPLPHSPGTQPVEIQGAPFANRDEVPSRDRHRAGRCAARPRSDCGADGRGALRSKEGGRRWPTRSIAAASRPASPAPRSANTAATRAPAVRRWPTACGPAGIAPSFAGPAPRTWREARRSPPRSAASARRRAIVARPSARGTTPTTAVGARRPAATARKSAAGWPPDRAIFARPARGLTGDTFCSSLTFRGGVPAWFLAGRKS